ncbi:MAG TPA: 3-deoxy-7-phosphoheptulonate synthase, partial [Spirochaetia bacterium]|nr:3-deoxy-7-phosphoheptulonate synthase [Spirochaetia bacterium]
MKRTNDLRIAESRLLISPATLKSDLPMTEDSNRTVVESREVITNILFKKDPRLLAVVGPC